MQKYATHSTTEGPEIVQPHFSSFQQPNRTIASQDSANPNAIHSSRVQRLNEGLVIGP